jgi:hypothetical protein
MDADLRGSARVSARRPSAGPAERESTEALTRLCAALYPVLRARDVDGFRRVLAAAEDVLGDTSELLAWPEERLRALMADMLREPRPRRLPRPHPHRQRRPPRSPRRRYPCPASPPRHPTDLAPPRAAAVPAAARQPACNNCRCGERPSGALARPDQRALQQRP